MSVLTIAQQELKLLIVSHSERINIGDIPFLQTSWKVSIFWATPANSYHSFSIRRTELLSREHIQNLNSPVSILNPNGYHLNGCGNIQ